MFLISLPIRTRLWLESASERFRCWSRPVFRGRRRLELSALEERILLSASPLGGLIAEAGDLLQIETGGESGGLTILLSENTNTTDGLSLGTLLAAHAEAGDGEGEATFTYSIQGGVDADRFSIGGDNSDQLIFNAGLLDFEVKAEYEVLIRATDAGGNSHDELLVVQVTDLNEPPTSLGLDDLVIAENTDTTGGFSVGTLSAADPDAGETLTYLILGGPDAANFSIAGIGSDELIFDAGVLDYETKSFYEVQIRVLDSAGHIFDETFGIFVMDEYEAPVASIAAFSLEENSAAGTLVGSVPIFDPAAGNDFTLEIVSGNRGGTFELDPQTGVLRVADPALLDFEAWPEFELIVSLEHQGTTSLGSVQISLTNVSIPPTAVDDVVLADARVFHFTLIDFTGNDSSPEGEKLAVIGFTDLGGAQIVDTGDYFTYTLPAGASDGTFHFTYFIQDESGNISSATMTLVLAVEEPKPRDEFPLPELKDIPLPAVNAVPQPPARVFAVPRMAGENEPAGEELGQPSAPADPGILNTAPAPDRLNRGPETASPEPPREEFPAPAAGMAWEIATPQNVPFFASPAMMGEWSANRFSADAHPSRFENLPADTRDSLPEENVFVYEVGEGSLVWQDLDKMASDIQAMSDFERIVIGAAVTVSSTLTVGYVLWLVRGGVLVGSLLAQMPAWRFVDPLPILEHLVDDIDADGPDQESLESILESSIPA